MRGSRHQDECRDDADPGAAGDEVGDQEDQSDVDRTERRAGDASGHVVAADRAHRRVRIDRKRLQPMLVTHDGKTAAVAPARTACAEVLNVDSSGVSGAAVNRKP